ncbi:LuxR C-terminal-related transcriptional regulator [Burkholderiaceae bacterium DAT-1]|nr:LuxR C-terminal-related transcriptional regulator [Burkholderiaceae bacterium DAT-1]
MVSKFHSVVTRGGEEYNITSSEYDILSSLAEGLTNKEIAHRRGTSVFTVNNQVHHLLKKVGARNRSQVVRVYLELQEKMAEPVA